MEILGNNLLRFFAKMKSFDSDFDAVCTYKGDRYEVHTVNEPLFTVMNEMSEEKFIELAGEDAWWRSTEGSNMGDPDASVIINGKEMLGWSNTSMKDLWDEEDGEEELENCYPNLTTYLCDAIGVSQPRNVCALAIDLARFNNMTMGELFAICEG